MTWKQKPGQVPSSKQIELLARCTSQRRELQFSAMNEVAGDNAGFRLSQKYSGENWYTTWRNTGQHRKCLH